MLNRIPKNAPGSGFYSAPGSARVALPAVLPARLQLDGVRAVDAVEWARNQGL